MFWNLTKWSVWGYFLPRSQRLCPVWYNRWNDFRTENEWHPNLAVLPVHFFEIIIQLDLFQFVNPIHFFARDLFLCLASVQKPWNRFCFVQHFLISPFLSFFGFLIFPPRVRLFPPTNSIYFLRSRVKGSLDPTPRRPSSKSPSSSWSSPPATTTGSTSTPPGPEHEAIPVGSVCDEKGMESERANDPPRRASLRWTRRE